MAGGSFICLAMNKILVLFDSASGNTEKMAHLVAEGTQRISETEVRVKSVDEATADDVVWCEGLAEAVRPTWGFCPGR